MLGAGSERVAGAILLLAGVGVGVLALLTSQGGQDPCLAVLLAGGLIALGLVNLLWPPQQT